MAVVWYRYLDFAAPRLHGERDGSSRTSAGSSLPEPREGFRLPSRGFSFRWSRRSAGARGHRMFLESPVPQQRTASAGDSLTYPSQMAALGRVVASTRDVLAAQAHVAAHKAARSHAP